MNIFGIDTNLLVYAHNTESIYHEKSVTFIEKVMNERDENGNLSVCIPAQVLMEFVYVITGQRLENPLSITEALQIVQDYLDSGIRILYQRETQIRTFIDLMSSVTSRKRVFDIALVATFKDHGVTGLYTANVADFQEFGFLEIINPIQTD